jgi:hypothetical protein
MSICKRFQKAATDLCSSSGEAVGESRVSIKYLAPYVFRVAISNRRIVKAEDHKVFFRYRKPHGNRWPTMAPDAMELMRRFL